MDDYKIIVEQEHQTVMAHYEVEAKPAEGYQRLYFNISGRFLK